MTQEVRNVFERSAFFQKVRRASVAQCVGAAALGLDSKLPEAAADDLPKSRRTERTIGLAEGHKDISAGAARPSLGQIAQDGFAYFVLQRVSLIPASLGSFDGKRFFAPVKIREPQTRDLAAAQSIDGTKPQDRLRADRRNSPLSVVPQYPSDIVPRWAFGHAIVLRYCRLSDSSCYPRGTPATIARVGKKRPKRLCMIRNG